MGERVVSVQAWPWRYASRMEVRLPRPRDQVAAREHPEFLLLRRELFAFIEARH